VGRSILHKDKDSGAVEPMLSGSFAGRGKLACWKAFQAEEDAFYFALRIWGQLRRLHQELLL